jgi:hypothetical protein
MAKNYYGKIISFRNPRISAAHTAAPFILISPQVRLFSAAMV